MPAASCVEIYKEDEVDIELLKARATEQLGTTPFQSCRSSIASDWPRCRARCQHWDGQIPVLLATLAAAWE